MRTRLPDGRWLLPWLLLASAFFGLPAGVAAQDDTSNLLRPGDELVIRVWPDTTLSGRYRVEMDGQAYLPLVGAVQVTGRTIPDLREELVAQYSEIMVSPVVIVVPRFRVSVLGAVRAPGLYFLEPPATLIDAVSLAGGFAERAKPEEIRLLRRGEVFGVDAEAAFRGEGDAASVPLQSGDRIVVPAGAGVSFLSVFQTVLSGAALVVSIIRLN